MKKRTPLLLPKQLLEDIQALNLTKINFNNCLKLISIIFKTSYEKFKNYDRFIPLPKKFIRIALSCKFYENILPLLVKFGILLKNKYYSKAKQICLEYCVNPKYFNLEKENKLVTTIYINKFKKIDKMETKENDELLNYFSTDMNSLNIPLEDIERIIEDKILNYKPNLDVDIDHFEVILKKKNSDDKKFYITKDDADRIAKEDGLSLIKCNNQYILQDLDTYIINKKANMKLNYEQALYKIKNQFFYAGRNTTNNRLDTNITNCSTDIWRVIEEKNDLVQIDLATSQFVILSNIISTENLNSADLIKFKALTKSGGLYEYIQQELNLSTRKEAKQIMFEMIFSHNFFRSNNKKKLTELFPTVMNWIKKYKESNGNNEFSILLQKFESNIFIDKIYLELKKLGLFCLTKHDSVIVKKNNFEIVYNLIVKVLKENNIEGNLVITPQLIENKIEKIKEICSHDSSQEQPQSTASTQSNIVSIKPKSKTIKELLAERALEASKKIDNKPDSDLIRIKTILLK